MRTLGLYLRKWRAQHSNSESSISRERSNEVGLGNSEEDVENIKFQGVRELAGLLQLSKAVECDSDSATYQTLPEDPLPLTTPIILIPPQPYSIK